MLVVVGKDCLASKSSLAVRAVIVRAGSQDFFRQQKPRAIFVFQNAPSYRLHLEQVLSKARVKSAGGRPTKTSAVNIKGKNFLIVLFIAQNYQSAAALLSRHDIELRRGDFDGGSN